MNINCEILLDFLNINIKRSSHIRLIIIIILFIIFIRYKKININNSVTGFIACYILFYIFGACKTGDNTFQIKYKSFHLHHWQLFTILLPFAIYYEYNSYIIGILFGGIAHGIQYLDWLNNI